MPSRDANILILCKTYPSPSRKYQETSCVAGMEENGSLIRLYPVPFRLIDSDQQFQKWQWVRAKVEKSHNDHRPESHKLQVGSIQPGHSVPTGHDWEERRRALSSLEIFDSPDQLEAARLSCGTSLGIVRVGRVKDLTLKEHKNKKWTEDDLSKLISLQDDLFGEDRKSIRQLEKIPVDFYYHYECDTKCGPVTFKHKIVDWEICALYRRLIRERGPHGWQEPFRKKMMEELSGKDLMLLMGNNHRFQDQWLIISVIYPPKQQQQPLF